jgi:hypothetical protein
MTTTRRRFLAALPMAGLIASGPATAALFGPDVREIEVGSSSSGVLDIQTSRRLTVRTRLVGIKTTRWIDRNGRTDPTMGSMTQNLYENKYDWQSSVQRSTDIWQITAEDLKEPGLMVLRVRATSMRPIAALFVGVNSPSSLDPEKGIELPPSEDSANECLALFRFDPALKHFVTVQADSDDRVPYRITVLPAGRFRR